jgi:hypothetical protein
VADVAVDEAEQDELEGGDRESETQRPAVAHHLAGLFGEDGEDGLHSESFSFGAARRSAVALAPPAAARTLR